MCCTLLQQKQKDFCDPRSFGTVLFSTSRGRTARSLYHTAINKMTTMSTTMTTVLLLLLCLVFSVPSFVEAGTNEKGLAFLAENKLKDGVVELPSGLQYKILTKGKGRSHPTVSSPCSCHYEGKLINGDVFDSSYQRGEPTTFAPNQGTAAAAKGCDLCCAG